MHMSPSLQRPCPLSLADKVRERKLSDKVRRAVLGEVGIVSEMPDVNQVLAS